MNRLTTLLLLLSLLFTGCASNTEPLDRRIGDGFAYLKYPHQTPDPAKIEVLVFFGYQCRHCLKFYEDELSDWAKAVPADVTVRLVPVVWAPSVLSSTRAFHAAETLGKGTALHAALFPAFQAAPANFSNRQALEDFAQRCCAIDRAQFRRAYDSPDVSDMMARDAASVREYNIGATPSIIVNGKYYIDPFTLPAHGTLSGMVDKLIKDERKK